MNIGWQKSGKTIRFGKSYWISLLLTIVLSTSCHSQNTNDKSGVAQDYGLKDGFYAVGVVYHRFGDARYPSTNTSKESFESHLQYLKENQFVTYTASGILHGGEDSSKKVLITIDDGLKSFLTNGYPLLKKYGCKATVFVNTESVGWSDYLSWDEIQLLHGEGIEIGAHSHRHSYFMDYPDSLRKVEFEKDLDVMEKEFKEHLGFVPSVYAYPYGEFDSIMADVLFKRGYKLGFAQNSGVWSGNTNQYTIPRFPVAGRFEKLESFVQKVNMKPLVIKSKSEYPVKLDGGADYTTILRLDKSNKYQTINCFFNNQYNKEIYKLSNDTLRIKLRMPQDKRRVLLTFTAQDDNNQWLWWSKLFVNPE